MKGRRIKKKKKIDADLEKQLGEFNVDSSDDLDDSDKILLENSRGKKRRLEEEEVLPISLVSSESESEHSNEEDLYGGGISSDAESEKADGLPDSKAWGSKRKDYYSTDYIDKDFSGFDDEEAALLEEQEAKEIQQRLLGELQDTDFTFGLLDVVEEKKKQGLLKAVKLDIEEKIKVDRSKLSVQDMKDFDERETPGFNSLMEECKNYVQFGENTIRPILAFAEEFKIKDCPAMNLIKRKDTMIWRLSLNFHLLLLLKSRRVSNISRHPINAGLHQIIAYLKKIETEEKGDLRKQMFQIAKLLKTKEGCKKIRVLCEESEEDKMNKTSCYKNRKERRKILQLLLQKEKEKTVKFAVEMGEKSLGACAEDIVKPFGMQETEDKVGEDLVEETKRAVTYQMLKNKGLTPKRKKEVRNPRVRNKNKYKKAVVRRKGQVKTARLELKKYDGEISGIKKHLNKSIKLG